MKCVHCCRNKASRSGRGLCRGCWNDPAVRQLYPPANRHTLDFHEPTEADLDALIAEQRKCLPAWWAADLEREAAR